MGAGWPTRGAITKLRLPHPLRFSKGGHHGCRHLETTPLILSARTPGKSHRATCRVPTLSQRTRKDSAASTCGCAKGWVSPLPEIAPWISRYSGRYNSRVQQPTRYVMALRVSKAFLVFAIALFYTTLVLNNVTDYGSNYQFVATS